MIELKTRFATDADAEAISALVNAAFKVERFFIDRDRVDPGKVREMLRTGKYLLAEDNGALIACVYVELRGQRAYFGLLGVDPMRQGQGLGRKERWWRKRRTTRERPAASSWICGSSISAANCRHFIGGLVMSNRARSHSRRTPCRASRAIS
jgi:predicted N-acetyltransferase YhbS